ncbi:hypothetical protein ACFVU2_17845 [Leifsonia sp. NPDC058194]|uniref:hypothetical protein n=1 Tax=Leifsonia sp. NPDC058194 TaxID=3346374 RepID=UPI0036DE425A
MTGRIAMDADLLRYQATQVDAIASDVAEASSAARTLNLGGGAFGVLCSFLVPPAQLVSAAAIQLLHESEALLHRTGTQLRSVAMDVEDREADLVRQLRTIERGLDR